VTLEPPRRQLHREHSRNQRCLKTMRVSPMRWEESGRRVSWSRFFPSYGPLYSIILFLLVPASALVYGCAWTHSVHLGFFVQLLTVDCLRRQIEPYSEAVFLTVEPKERWTLNGKGVSPCEIPVVLSDLRFRGNCVVFLDVDKDLPYSVAIHAIDSAQGTGFKVTLLTPGTKKMRIP
jgi:hypothetical protein